MEQVGSDPSRVFGTVHTQQSGGTGTGAEVNVPDACTAFHNYQLNWTADAMAIGIDGVVYYRYVNPGTGMPTWPFNAPQYLLLNIAIGGNLGGSIDDAIFPVVMEIDHVRVYQARP
jgi:beta-glucanase (GH16 family)